MRRSSAPGASPDTGGSRPGAHRAARRGGASGRTIDLGAIRQTDSLLDLLAARRLAWRAARRDPAVAVLRVLTADVDAPAAPRGGAPARSSPAPGAAGPVTARHAGAAVTAPRRRAGWARPVTSAAMIAGSLAALLLAATAAVTGLMAAGMIVRVVRLGATLPDGSGGFGPAPRHGPGRRGAGRSVR